MNAATKNRLAWLLGGLSVWLWIAGTSNAGCASNHCLRNTDCPPGYECSQGGCRIPPETDGGSDAGDSGDGGDSGDNGDASMDAGSGNDADADDSSVDADASGDCDPDAEAGTDGGCVETDASADGSVDAQPVDASGDSAGDAHSDSGSIPDSSSDAPAGD